MRRVSILAVAGVMAVLAGCVKEAPSICPAIGILESAAQVTRFRPGASQEPANVAYRAEITGVDLDCAYETGALNEMEVNLRIQMAGGKGPAATADKMDLQYFVVITDSRGTVITKKVFPATIAFEGRQQVRILEEIWQYYYLKSGGTGALFEIWVGFQLSDQDIDYNRRTRS